MRTQHCPACRQPGEPEAPATEWFACLTPSCEREAFRTPSTPMAQTHTDEPEQPEHCGCIELAAHLEAERRPRE